MILSVPAEDVETVLAIAEEEGAPACVIGRVRGERLAIGIEGEDCMDLPVGELHEIWSTAFERLCGGGSPDAGKGGRPGAGGPGAGGRTAEGGVRGGRTAGGKS